MANISFKFIAAPDNVCLEIVTNEATYETYINRYKSGMVFPFKVSSNLTTTQAEMIIEAET